MAFRPITTVLRPAESYDLTTLAVVKSELRLSSTDDDAWLTRTIGAVSRAITNYCNAVFPVETVRDVLRQDRLAPLYRMAGVPTEILLSRGGVLTGAATLPLSAAAASGAVLLNFAHATAGQVQVGMPVFVAGIPDDAYVVGIAPGASSSSDVVTISAPCAAAIASGTTISFGTRVAVTDPSGAVTDYVLGTDYDINPATGTLIRLAQGANIPWQWPVYLTRVWYRAGFDTIPGDLEDAAIRMVTQRFTSRGRDPFIKTSEQPGLGTTTYWVGGANGSSGMFPQDIEGILDNYRIPSV